VGENQKKRTWGEENLRHKDSKAGEKIIKNLTAKQRDPEWEKGKGRGGMEGGLHWNMCVCGEGTPKKTWKRGFKILRGEGKGKGV